MEKLMMRLAAEPTQKTTSGKVAMVFGSDIESGVFAAMGLQRRKSSSEIL